MKKIFNYLSVILLVMITLYSCEDDLGKTVVAPVASGTFSLTLSSDNIILNKINATRDTAITFNWNNPKELYGINTSVKYEIQMDSLSGDFSKSVGTELMDTIKSFTDADMNATALQLKLVPEEVGKIKVRLKATLAHGASPIYSVVDTISVTPYVEYVPTELYLIGDAVASGWGWDHYPLPSEQKMTKIDDNRFELVIALKATGKFTFITSADNWTDPAYKAATDHEPLVGGNFITSGSANDWKGKEIGVLFGDLYRVTVDFRTHKYSIVPVIPSELYLQGDAAISNWAYPVPAEQKMTKINDHVFQLHGVKLKAGALAFITSADHWTDPAYRAASAGESLINGSLITTGVNNPGEEYDIMIPIEGDYNITVDFATKKYNIVLLPPSELYLQGDAVTSNWTYPVTAEQKMTKIDDHTFQLLGVELKAGALVFITNADHWTDPAYRATTATESLIDGNLTTVGTNNPGGGYDIMVPSNGVYDVTVDFQTRKYTIALKAIFAPPAELYIIGAATPLGWNAPDGTQKFNKIGPYKFSITLPLVAWGQYAFITNQLTWTDPAYIAKTNAEPEFGGEFVASGSSNGYPGSNIIAPAISGTYTITVDFTDGTYTLSN